MRTGLARTLAYDAPGAALANLQAAGASGVWRRVQGGWFGGVSHLTDATMTPLGTKFARGLVPKKRGCHTVRGRGSLRAGALATKNMARSRVY